MAPLRRRVADTVDRLAHHGDLARLLLTLLVCGLLWLTLTVAEANRDVSYANAARQCRILVLLGEDFASDDPCVTDPRIAPRFDHGTGR